MCKDQIMHQFYTHCRRGQHGGEYHWFPAAWPLECGIPDCGGYSLDPEPIIFWCIIECPGCESGETSAGFWQVNGKQEYGLPPHPRWDDVFAAPGAPERYIRSVHSSRTSSPPPSASATSSRNSRASDAGSHSSQLSFKTQLVNSLRPGGEWDQFLENFQWEDMDSYIDGFIDPTTEVIPNTPSQLRRESTTPNASSRSQSHSSHAGSRTSSRATEASTPPSQSQNSGPTTPKARPAHIPSSSGTQSSSSRAATPMDITQEPEYIANPQLGSSSKSKASKPRPVNTGKHLDSPKALRSGKRY